MTRKPIRDLFSSRIDRRIEEVIKVDQTDEEILCDEIEEYVVTDAIRKHYTDIFETYLDTPNRPHEGIAIWISGFFGSGKSSFAKMLGLAIHNPMLDGVGAAKRFSARSGNNKMNVLLTSINERIPTHAVIFDVSTERGIRSGNQTLTEIMYGLFLQSLGYAKDLDLANLEITLEDQGRLALFEEQYQQIYNKDWNHAKGQVAFALSEASRVIHTLEPDTYPQPDSWARAARSRADITPHLLAERVSELMKRRRPNQSLVFVVDEVGQFVARDVQKMLDLQAIVHSLGVKGRGKHWLVVTSQERLTEMVSGLDDNRIELARLMDRFSHQVHLEPSDITEVTSRRVLLKNSVGQTILGGLYDQHRASLADHTHMTADIRFPELSRESFIDLYPLLPYQIDLIIQVVSGLRTQGGAGRHVGGANRTIIKLAQQLLINPAVNLAEHPVGTLVQLDQVYDLVEGNIGSDIRAKIATIPQKVAHPLAQSVAKVICLLQYVKSVHRTAENIAAALLPSVGSDSRLVEVKEALNQLEMAHQVRLGEDGYRIPTPVEDDWENNRNSITPKPGDVNRLYAEILGGFWQPQPRHSLYDTREFKAGLAFNGRELVAGDLLFCLHFVDNSKDVFALSTEMRASSQLEKNDVLWGVVADDLIDRECVEVYRSREILSRKEREARTADEVAMIGEERVRLNRHLDELKRLLKKACLAGHVFFRGNDRSPNDNSVDVGRTASDILGQVLPDVFERYRDASARSVDFRKGMEAMLSADNLQGLPNIFHQLGLIQTDKNITILRVDSGPMAEVMSRIEARANYGESVNGRSLSDEFIKEPFGWDFEAVRLFVLCLLRAGKIDVTSRGQVIHGIQGTEAREIFNNNNLFRSASFRPKVGMEFSEIVKAAEAFRETFGVEARELSVGSMAYEIRRELDRVEDGLADVRDILNKNDLPGMGLLEDALQQMRAFKRGSDEDAISIFNASFRIMKDAIKRSKELAQVLTESTIGMLARAKQVLGVQWFFLRDEPDTTSELRGKAELLADTLLRETFFREVSQIEQYTDLIGGEYNKRYEQALAARMDAYSEAYRRLIETSGWDKLDNEQQERISSPIRKGMVPAVSGSVSILQLRADTDACETRLRSAITEVHRFIEGERLITISVEKYFSDGIETEEQLDAVLQGIREECGRLIGEGKKVVVR